MTLTGKQRQILDAIIMGNPDGTWLDLDQLLEVLPYKPTKQALQFSLRFLENRSLLVKKDLEFRRGQMRRIIAPTSDAYEIRKM